MAGGWGGARPRSGPKKAKASPDKGRSVAAPKLAHNQPDHVPAEVKAKINRAEEAMWLQAMPLLQELSEKYSQNKLARTEANNPFKLPWFPDVAKPLDKKKQMAMDNAMVSNAGGWLAGGVLAGVGGEGLAFLGYTYLSELAQRPEYRVMAETIADDATRKWITFDVTGDERTQAELKQKDPDGFEERMADPDERKKRVAAAGKMDKVKAIEDDQERLEMQSRFYDTCRNDGFFGRSHLFLDFGEDQSSGNPELAMPIGNGREALSRGKVSPAHPLRALRAIEPVWTYPLMYNANNPLRADWYNPQVWYVMGQEIHGSRIPCFVGHPVPDMLKPAYAFGGLSMTQMAQPYVDIWLTTRQSVALLIKSFSVMVLKTDVQTLLAPQNAANLLARVAMWNMFRDNQGAFILNKNTEDFANVSAPISGLDKIQAQAQEHMASVSRIPLVKLTGISPSGLNATSEQEIEVYDDTIMAYQHRLMTPKVETVINFQQLSLFGEIDPEISWRWAPLREMTEAEKGQKQKNDSDRDTNYVDAGVLAPEEVRKRIIEDPDMPYADLDPNDVPDLLEEEEEGLEPEGGRPDPKAEGEPDKGGGASDAIIPFAGDEWLAVELDNDVWVLAQDEATFEESKHPRDSDGKFSSGGGGGGSTPSFKSKKEHVAHLLGKGTTAAEILKATGWPTVSVPQQASAAGMKLVKYKEGGVTKYKGTPMTDAEKAEAAQAAKAAKLAKGAQSGPVGQSSAPAAAPAPVPAPAPAAAHPKPTDAELSQAKKSAPLQLGYVPGAKPTSGTFKDAADKLVKEFNNKYAGKPLTDPAALAEKVHDFKAIQGKINDLGQEQSKHAAAAAKVEAELKAKAAAEAAKKSAETNKEIIKGLGISEKQAEGVAALAQMLGSSTGDIVSKFKKYEDQAKDLGYPINGFQAALIKNYSDGGYSAVNASLRSGAWTPAQHVYVSMVNRALDQMPKYTGQLNRGATLSAEQRSKYKAGHIVMEDAFMSTSTAGGFSGSTRFKVTAIGKRGASIKKLSNSPGENEVLFQARTFFKVNKVSQDGGQTVIEMEEWEE